MFFKLQQGEASGLALFALAMLIFRHVFQPPMFRFRQALSLREIRLVTGERGVSATVLFLAICGFGMFDFASDHLAVSC